VGVELAEVCRSILVIDDLADRPHAADVLLDQNLRPTARSPTHRWCRTRAGCCLVRAMRWFVTSTSGHDARGASGTEPGGFWSRLEAWTILRLSSDHRRARQLEMQLETVDLVVADPDLLRDALGSLATGLPLRIHGPQPHLAGLMPQADLAVGAGGSTTWERLCVGFRRWSRAGPLTSAAVRASSRP
jgi:UDP-2,4-diacetamido-2,4,6-trideoxy-beta-L-altropyranose hydrolase